MLLVVISMGKCRLLFAGRRIEDRGARVWSDFDKYSRSSEVMTAVTRITPHHITSQYSPLPAVQHVASRICECAGGALKYLSHSPQVRFCGVVNRWLEYSAGALHEVPNVRVCCTFLLQRPWISSSRFFPLQFIDSL